MNQIRFDFSHALPFLSEEAILKMEKEAVCAREKLFNKTGAGSDFLGWVDYPIIQEAAYRTRVHQAADKIRSDSDILLVIGIGGSYLGARAAIELLKPYFSSSSPEVIFVGNTLSSQYTQELVEYCRGKRFSINIISKSGKTMEPAIAFRIFRTLLEEQEGVDANKRIYATTDAVTGALREQAIEAGWERFDIPADIGGRYSILTAVGLLPIAVAGYDIEAMMEGAKEAHQVLYGTPFRQNPAMLYASCRNLLARQDKTNEFFVAYEPNMFYFLEWLKQLLGESEGKNHKGLFPVSVINTTDLHSLGQYIQDGQRFLFETVFHFTHSHKDMIVPPAKDNKDELDSLVGKSLHYINEQAMTGTVLAHIEGGVPNLMFHMEPINEHRFGYLVYFFMFATGISAYILGVNPFDQPGVEHYKKKMLELLGT
ncbi:MAG: glucose-6-phosphate isomerase [Bacilli bacterium]